MNLIKFAKSRSDLLQLTAQYIRDKLDIFSNLAITEKDITNICGSLHNYQDRWLYIPPRHPWHQKTWSQVNEIFEVVPKDAVFVVDSLTRHCLIVFDQHVFPAVFLHSPDSTRFFRIVVGDQVRWLGTLRECYKSFVFEKRQGAALVNSKDDSLLELEDFNGEVSSDDIVSRRTGAGFKP